DSRQIHLVAIGADLHAIRQAAFNVLKESGSTPRVSPASHPRDSQLALSFDSDERPDIAAVLFLQHFRRNILLFRSDVAPDFVNLNSLSLNVADRGILIGRASLADFGQQTQDS